MFVLSFENQDDRTSFAKCYTPSVEIEQFNVLIDGKNLSNVPIKNEKLNIWKYYWNGKK